MTLLHEDRLFSPHGVELEVARELYAQVKDLPLICPHGHTDPSWYADDVAFEDPASLFIIPDHYVVRMLYSQGVPLEKVGIAPTGEPSGGHDPEEVWRTFAAHYHLFRATPTRMWLDWCFQEHFGLEEPLSPATADRHFQVISDCLGRPEFRARALYESFGIEVLSTTDSPLDDLASHLRLAADDSWSGRVVPCYRPDCVVDPQRPDFVDNVAALGELTGCDVETWSGYLDAHRARRAFFKELGATASDHGHPTARTADLGDLRAGNLYNRVMAGDADPDEAELFRAQMLTEMAGMSLDDGLVMQLHPGSWRSHNKLVHSRYGPDHGDDIPQATEYVGALKPLLDKFGNDPALTLILFTLDESAYSRELAPLAGHYPALRLGPPWWFLDSYEGMMRFREQVTETAGFANTVGFNDDTRAYLSLPARHDMARRVDCAYLARLVADHRLARDEAGEVAKDLSYNLARKAYRY